MSVQFEDKEILSTEVGGRIEKRNTDALNGKTTEVDANEQVTTVDINSKESGIVCVANCTDGTGGVLPTSHTQPLAISVGSGGDVDGGSRSASSKSSAHSGEGRRRGLGGSATLSLGEFDVVIEELRMRRALNAENEEKITHLVEEKHQLQQKYDEVDLKHHKAVEQCSNQEQEIRAKYSNKLKQIEEEKVRHLHVEESREKEIRGLKDEIRTLQLAKYNVEKKVEEQERQLQLHSTSQESFLTEISHLEQRCQAAMRQGSEIVEQMSHLEANVKQAVELNRRLQYVNEHQKCIVDGYKKQLESCRQQLVDARVSLADSQAEMSEVGESIGKKAVRTTEQELKMHAELTKQLQLQLGSLREEHQRVLLQLKEAHSLIDKHAESSNKLHSSEELLKAEFGSLKDSNEKMLAELTDIQQKMTSTTEEWTTEKQQWANKTAEIEQRLRCLQGDYVSLQDSHAKLEAHSSARETQLLSELKENAVREKRREDDVEREKERLVEEWRGRVRQLEEAQALPTKYLQHEAVQVSSETIQNSAGPILQPSTSLNSTASIGESPSVDMVMEDQKSAVEPTIPPPPSPPHTPVMSPDVISDSNSPSTDKDCLTTKAMKLTLPRLQVEKIQLHTQKEPKSTHAALGENSEKNKLNKNLLVPVGYSEPKVASIAHVSSFSPPKTSSSSVSQPRNSPSSISPPQTGVSSASPLKRRLDSTEAVDGDTVSKGKGVSKKQKMSEESNDSQNLLPAGHQPVEEDLRSLSQQALVSDRGTFVHLLQSSETVSSTPEIKEGRSSLKSHGHLTDIPWKLEMPKPPAKLCVPRRLDTEEKPVNILPAESNENQLHMFEFPAGTQGTTGIVLRQNRQHFLSADSLPAKQSISQESRSLNEVPNPGTTHTDSSKVTSENTTISSVKDFGCNEITANRKSSALNTPSQSSSEQTLISKSSPKFDSDGNGGNFAVVFSDGEGEGESGDSLLSSQMSRQINKVHTFLKMDRLRRTKVSKTK